MSKDFEQISKKQGFMKHNGGVLFKNISDTEYEFRSVINENHLNAAEITHGGYLSALIDAGADIHMKTEQGESMYDVAVSRGHPAVASFLRLAAL